MSDLGNGVTITDLAEMFGYDRKEIRKRIGDMPPYRTVGARELYRVKDVAGRLTKFDDSMTDVVRQILATHHTDLPKMLSKEFWYGQNQRTRFLRDTGDLWDTAAIVELASEVFKTLRLSLTLAADAVERETGLTERQRGIVENIIREALNETREQLVVRLSHLRRTSQGKSYLPAEVREAGRFSASRNGADEPRPGDPDYL